MIQVHTKLATTLVYPVQLKTIDKLLADPRRRNEDNLATEPTVVDLVLNRDPKKRPKGATKMAFFGTANVDIFRNGEGGKICAKQTYYILQGDGPRAKQRMIAHDRATQLRNLSTETSCLVWASSLLSLVYAFIEKQLKRAGSPPPFDIPQLRFIKAALAIEQNDKNDNNAFFLEEHINPDVEGPFRKYLNNDSAKPLALRDRADQERGEFLAFTQHVQYWKTQKLVFVSDYQGQLFLLLVTLANYGLCRGEHTFNRSPNHNRQVETSRLDQQVHN